MSSADALAVFESLPAPVEPVDWPGVDDPDALRAQLADWFSQYANAGTRRTYAYALGLPVSWVDRAPVPSARRPPAAPAGPLHDLAWFRWCARIPLDPRAATGTHVKAWLHALDAAGAQRRTRQRMLSTLSALYGHLAETGVVAANPAALNRARLGLTAGARDASPTVRLTAGQVAALLSSAARPTVRGRRAELYARREVAFVALLTLGLRISEITGLDRADLRRSGGDDVLRVLGKGGLHREVYVTALVGEALSAYLTERDRHDGAATPARRGRTTAGSEPMLATREGGRCSRVDLYTRLRRIAATAGPELDGVADRVHPHALRHAYVTIALEQDARIQHVQADVGHATIATTQHYDRGLRTRDTTAADAVAAAVAQACREAAAGVDVPPDPT
ncbi:MULTISPECIES: tyrosine-type recombinase/integrase [unclassified Pseudonocardia]|uniref:tyrosine-type recombinase/integrase n=1 Tax=unclassified Pseudonocardia TaxID=2619320 RepID=UPI000A49E735|nr:MULTISPECIES: tyrosine-type recombinase/integrase [unclassified Pseudonocardia]MBN9102052.1 tyrosine-type recombinase/integrase [Pseudonocardia sp.]